MEGDVTLVVHDWGGPLGFDWARRHAEAVNGCRLHGDHRHPSHWEDWPEDSRGLFQGMRSEAGEEIILKKNVFVERILLPRSSSRSRRRAWRVPQTLPGSWGGAATYVDLPS